MDVEKTIQAILESHRQAAERATKAEERLDRAEELAAEREAKANERMDLADARAAERDAKAIERMNLAEAKAIRAHARAMDRADKADQRMDRFDIKLNKTADLVRAGVKMVGEMRVEMRELKRLHKDLDYKFNALVASQIRTDEAMRKTDLKFDRWIESLRRKNGNGRH